MTDPSNSPLAEPSISELFSIDPIALTDAQFDRIIDEFRAQRHSWNAQEKAKASNKNAPKVAKGSVKDVSLDDLLGGSL